MIESRGGGRSKSSLRLLRRSYYLAVPVLALSLALTSAGDAVEETLVSVLRDVQELAGVTKSEEPGSASAQETSGPPSPDASGPAASRPDGQQASLEGELSEDDGDPLAGVSIRLEPYALTTTTGPDGKFHFPVLRLPSRSCVRVTVILRGEGHRTRAIDVYLRPGANRMPPLRAKSDSSPATPSDQVETVGSSCSP